jgi:AsmA protein
MKALRRVLKFIFVLFALVLLALLAFVATFDANNYKAQIIQRVESATGRDFAIDGDINLSLFPWVGLKLGAVSLGNEKGFKAKQFAAIKQLDIKINVLPLLKKEVEVNTIRLHGLNVSLEVAKDKSNNWSSLSQTDTREQQASTETTETKQPQAEGQDETPLLASLKVEGFEFVDAKIQYDDRSSGTTATVSELNLKTTAIAFDQAIDISFETHIESNQPVIDTRINLTSQLSFNRDFSRFDLKDLVVTVLADANEFIPQQETVEIRSDINVLMDEQRLTLKGLQLSALGTTTRFEMTVTQFMQTPVIQGDIEVLPFNAREVAGRVAVELPEMAKAGALHHMALKTKIKLHGENLQANDFRLTVDNSTLSGWLHVPDLSRQQLRYELAFDQLNINDYMPPVAEAAITQAAATDAEAGSGDEKIELPLEMLRQLDVQGDFRIAQLTVLEYDIKQFLLTTKASKGVIDLKPLSMQVLEGQVKSAVELDARKNMPAYSINLEANQIQVGPVVNPILDGLMGEKPPSMEGRVKMTMNVKTSGETVKQLKKAGEGQIIFDMKQTAVHDFDPEYYVRSSMAAYVKDKAYDMSDTIMSSYKPRQVIVFDKIFSTVNLADGRATTDDFIMAAQRVNVGATGHVDIMNNTMDMKTTVTLPRGKTTLEKILDEPMPVRVYGPFDALEYELDTDRLKKATSSVLQDEAKAKLAIEKQKLKAKADEASRHAEEKAR